MYGGASDIALVQDFVLKEAPKSSGPVSNAVAYYVASEELRGGGSPLCREQVKDYFKVEILRSSIRFPFVENTDFFALLPTT